MTLHDKIEAQTELLPPLATFEVDDVTGFVPPTQPLERLPDAFAAWDALVPDISALLRSGRIRPVLEALPTLDPSSLATRAEQERAMLLLSTFGNSYVWGGKEQAGHIPASVAVPLWALSQALDRPPILGYASSALYNWRKVDPNGAIEVDNMRTLVRTLGGVDEEWFYLGAIGVELAGARFLPALHRAVNVSVTGSDAELAGLLGEIAAGMGPVNVAIDAVRDWCDPHIFYTRLRPYLAGWPAPGVVYEGVSDERRVYVGGSAGQSSLIQVVDGLLAVDHVGTPAGDYLRKIRAYMPVPHRNFVTEVERLSRVRERVGTGTAELREAYNEAVRGVDTFRRKHIGLAHDYIAKMTGNTGLGTGGTDFVSFLREARVRTVKTKL